MKNFIVPFALAQADIGYCNQLLGAINAINNLTGNSYKAEDLLIMPEDVEYYTDIKNPLFYSKFKNYTEFKNALFNRLDKFMHNTPIIPRIFITAFNNTESSTPEKNADKLCCAIQEYYKEHNYGKIFTVILTSKYYKYKHIDFINIPKHLLTFSSRIRLLKENNLRKKVLITTGTINNFSIQNINNRHKELTEKFENLKNNTAVKDIIDKFNNFENKNKKIVFLLGGRVDGNEIICNIEHAQKLFNQAQQLAAIGYGIVFVNGHRTPNSVCDFLYEKSLKEKNIIFHNCKKIAQNNEDRDFSKWRIYSGKYEKEFNDMTIIGNIYPGILGYNNTMVVHTMDSYSSCETASVGIPSAISSTGVWVDPQIRYDCHNLLKLLTPRYAIDFDEFVKIAISLKIEPKDLQLQILSNVLRVFAETVINKYITTNKKY